MAESHHFMMTFCENIQYKILGGLGYLFSDVGNCMLQLDSEISLFLDTFAQHYCRVTVSCVVSGHLSAWNSLAPASWICVQIGVEVFCDHFGD